MQTNQLQGGIVHQAEATNFNMLGHSITPFLTKEKSNGAYFVFEVATPPGQGVPKHVHELEDELIYMTEGEFQIELGDKTFTAKAGDSIFFPRGVAHSFQNASDKATKAIFTVSPGASFEDFFNTCAALPAGPPDMSKIDEIFSAHGMTILHS